MADRILLTRFSRQLNKEDVLHQLSCPQESSAHEELQLCCQQLEPFFWSTAVPKAVIAFSKAPKDLQGPYLQTGDDVAYLMSTIGGGVEQLAKQYFEKNNYLAAMVLHAMADTYLFGMEKQLLERFRQACKARNVGAEKRLEAPANLPIQAQRLAVQEIDASNLLGVSVTEGLMLYPVKSCWFLVKLTSDCSVFCAKHDCADCTNYNCPNRKET